MFRIGQGYDTHALVPGRPLILGGVEIPHDRGLLGHSDADALLHAMIDALLGAAGLGDIGRHFPDTDPRYAGANSRVLLRATHDLIGERGWQVVNVDSTIIAQGPKMAPYVGAMVRHIAEDLQVDPAVVNIKAKTNERLGPEGRGESVTTQAVVLLQRRARPEAES